MIKRDGLLTVALLVAGMVFILHPMLCVAEFYRYVTREGVVHYVGDRSLVPEEYQQEVKVYAEKYDHLGENERALMLQKDREMDASRRQEEQRLREQREQEARLKRLETDVTIEANQVLVPVTIGYGLKEVKALFLLDTGASHLVLFNELARKLSVASTQKGLSMVAGGNLIETELIVLDYLKLGPLDLKNVEATVIKHEAQTDEAVRFSGLLGMNILRNLRYTIDFENQKIRWQPVE
ncbi:MAG: aspartyl protease family protein [Desulfobacterales bacterium]|jgi:predicted aspartyl protease